MFGFVCLVSPVPLLLSLFCSFSLQSDYIRDIFCSLSSLNTSISASSTFFFYALVSGMYTLFLSAFSSQLCLLRSNTDICAFLSIMWRIISGIDSLIHSLKLRAIILVVFYTRVILINSHCSYKLCKCRREIGYYTKIWKTTAVDKLYSWHILTCHSCRMQLTSGVHSQLLIAFLKNTITHCKRGFCLLDRERERERKQRRRKWEMEREVGKKRSVFTYEEGKEKQDIK